MAQHSEHRMVPAEYDWTLRLDREEESALRAATERIGNDVVPRPRHRFSSARHAGHPRPKDACRSFDLFALIELADE